MSVVALRWRSPDPRKRDGSAPKANLYLSSSVGHFRHFPPNPCGRRASAQPSKPLCPEQPTNQTNHPTCLQYGIGDNPLARGAKLFNLKHLRPLARAKWGFRTVSEINSTFVW